MSQADFEPVCLAVPSVVVSGFGARPTAEVRRWGGCVQWNIAHITVTVAYLGWSSKWDKINILWSYVSVCGLGQNLGTTNFMPSYCVAAKTNRHSGLLVSDRG
eukprot:TRINITY_DN1788_c0_g3_i2.p1 TRINITY_DN1788_c0_g3~~TRINITY_DN1788_c0_g3_i2.p1  ORF type:complete len:103 (-),score=9.26 TRINITY_DN1788_c0_g3_i2:348-656(-)